MREYDHRSLANLLRTAGFADVKAMIAARGKQAVLPLAVMSVLENVVENLPGQVRAAALRSGISEKLFGLTLVGIKS